MADESAMPSFVQRRKPELTAYQKQIRFLTGVSILICSLAALFFVWLLNLACR
jgi:hypothetical protein